MAETSARNVMGVHRQLEEIFRFPVAQQQQQAVPKMSYDAVMDVVDPHKLARTIRNCFQVAYQKREAQKNVYNALEKSLSRCIDIYDAFKANITRQQNEAAIQYQRGYLNFYRNKMANNETQFKKVDEMMSSVMEVCENELNRAFSEGDQETQYAFINLVESTVSELFERYVLTMERNFGNQGNTPPTKRQKTRHETEDDITFRNNVLELINKAERNVILSFYLKMLIRFVRPANVQSSPVKLHLNSTNLDRVLHLDEILDLTEIKKNYSNLIQLFDKTRHGWLRIFLGLNFPDIIAPYALGQTIIQIHTDHRQTPRHLDLISTLTRRKPSIIITLLQDLFEKFVIGCTEGAITKQHVTVWKLLMTLIRTTKGTLSIMRKEWLMRLVNNSTQSHIDVLESIKERGGRIDDVLTELIESIVERIEEWEEGSFDMMYIIGDIAEKRDGAQSHWAREYLESIVDKLQRDCMTRPIPQSTLLFCALLQPHFTKILNIIHNRSTNGYIWQYTVECMGLAGGIPVATNMTVDMFCRQKFEGDFEFEVFMGMFGTFSAHLHAFETMFMDKIYWRLVETNIQPDESNTLSSTIIHNIHHWITHNYHSIINSYIIDHWQLLYPFLYVGTFSDRLLVLEIVQTALQSKFAYTVSVTCALALISLFFFLLDPAFVKRESSIEELSKCFITEPENDQTSSLYRIYFTSRDCGLMERFRQCIVRITSTLCRDKRVAEQVFGHSLDLILSAHMDSRLRLPQRGMSMSMQVHAQVNFPLHEYSNLVELLNEYMPRCGDARMFELSHLLIPREKRIELVKEINADWKCTTEPTMTSKTKLLNSLMKQNKMGEDKRLQDIRARGVVMVNAKKVQLRRKTKQDEKKDSQEDKNETIIKHNELLVLDLLSRCNHVDALAQQLSKLLNVSFVSVAKYEQYCTILPKKPMTERDVFIDKLFNNYPILSHLLGYIAQKEPIRLLEFKSVIQSLIVNCIGDWNAVVMTLNKDNKSRQKLIERTIRILRYLQDGQWIVAPMTYVIDLIPSLQANEIVQILLSVFHFVNNYAPKLEEYNITDAGVKRTLPIECDVQVYMQSTKDALREHVQEFAPIYSRFFITQVE